MSNLRMTVGIQLEDEIELSLLMKNGSASDEDEVQRPERGLQVMSRQRMTRRLQSLDARGRNSVDHVDRLYRNR